jgi:hypothetical protein
VSGIFKARRRIAVDIVLIQYTLIHKTFQLPVHGGLPDGFTLIPEMIAYVGCGDMNPAQPLQILKYTVSVFGIVFSTFSHDSFSMILRFSFSNLKTIFNYKHIKKLRQYKNENHFHFYPDAADIL